MAKVENMDRVVAQLRALEARSRKEDNVSVSVGYSQSYALRVHEDRNAYHAEGRAGFLTDVAREMARELGNLVRTLLLQGRDTAQALLVAGLRLQRESQKNVPVDTGALRASAFTRLE